MTHDLTRTLHQISSAAGDAAPDGNVATTREHVRRRRRQRAAAAVGVSLAVVGAAIAVPVAVLGSPDGEDAADAVSWDACERDVSTAASLAHGQAPVYDDDGPVRMRLHPADAATSGEAWLAAEVTHAGSGIDEFAVVEADGAPLLMWIVDDEEHVVGVGRIIGQYPDLPTAAAGGEPVWMDVGFDVMPCGGVAGTDRGDVLPPGNYDMVAAVGVAPGAQATSATAVVLARASVTMEPEEVPEVDARCGAAWSDSIVASTDGYEFGLRLDGPVDLGEVVPQPEGGDGARFTVTATNTSDSGVEGVTGHPWIVVVRNDVVVGSTGGREDIALGATMSAGASIEYDAWVPLHDCTTVGVSEDTSGRDPLPAGTYELYAVMDFLFTAPAGDDGPEDDRTDVTAVGGPWSVTVP